MVKYSRGRKVSRRRRSKPVRKRRTQRVMRGGDVDLGLFHSRLLSDPQLSKAYRQAYTDMDVKLIFPPTQMSEDTDTDTDDMIFLYDACMEKQPESLRSLGELAMKNGDIMNDLSKHLKFQKPTDSTDSTDSTKPMIQKGRGDRSPGNYYPSEFVPSRTNFVWVCGVVTFVCGVLSGGVAAIGIGAGISIGIPVVHSIIGNFGSRRLSVRRNTLSRLSSHINAGSTGTLT